MIRPLVLSSLLVLTGVAACGGSQRVDPSSYTEAAEYAYAEAERVFERRDYELARVKFAELAQEFPYSQYAALSELRIADCYFEERSYPLAIDAYRRFVRFHPRHDQVIYAESQVARSYYEQMPRDWFLMPPAYERELSSAESAYQALGLFLSTYPETEYSDEIRELRDAVMNRLASHELYVAEFYVNRDNYLAAGRRTAFLMEHYPEAEAVPEALFLQARAMLELDDRDAGVAALRELMERYPDHQLGREAAHYLERYGL